MIEQFASRFGLPSMIDFRSDGEKYDYARECARIRDSLPAGECRVAPRLSLSSYRGRVLDSGASVSAADFGEGDAGHFKLEEHIFAGLVLRSERESDADRESIAQHVERVKALNEKFVSDTTAAKLDRLLEQKSK